jgi:hypothetical protein
MAKVIMVNCNGQKCYAIICPACKTEHLFNEAWTFNGNFNKPTFSPSMLYTTGHYIPGHQGRCWCDYNKEHPNQPAPFGCVRCHSFVIDGKIQFLSDCTHEMKGQTVELLDVEVSNE